MVNIALRSSTLGRCGPSRVATLRLPGYGEEHLLHGYLPAVYAPDFAADRSDYLPRPRVYRPEQAVRWLTFLARHLHAEQTRDFAWWNLVNAVTEARRSPLIEALLFYVEAPLRAVVLAGRSAEWVLRPHPLRLRPRRLLSGILIAVGTGLSVSLGYRFIFGLLSFPGADVFGLVTGSLVGIITVFGNWLGHWSDCPPGAPKEEPSLVDPRSALRQDRASFLVVTLVSGLVFGAVFSFAFGPGTGTTVGLVAGPLTGYGFGPQLGLGGGWLSLGDSAVLARGAGLPAMAVDALPGRRTPPRGPATDWSRIPVPARSTTGPPRTSSAQPALGRSWSSTTGRR